MDWFGLNEDDGRKTNESILLEWIKYVIRKLFSI